MCRPSNSFRPQVLAAINCAFNASCWRLSLQSLRSSEDLRSQARTCLWNCFETTPELLAEVSTKSSMSRGCGLTEEDLEELESQSATSAPLAQPPTPLIATGNRPYNAPSQSASDPAASGSSSRPAVIMCCKCKLVPASARIRQRENICAACLEAGVLHKVQHHTLAALQQ